MDAATTTAGLTDLKFRLVRESFADAVSWVAKNLPTLPADLFAEAIGQVAIAAGRDDTLPMLTGIRVEISGDTVVLAATDRFRLAVRELTWSTELVDIEAAVLVPA